MFWGFGSVKCADFSRRSLRSIVGHDVVRGCWSTQTGGPGCQMSAISPLSLSALSTCTSTHARPPTLTPCVPFGKTELFALVALTSLPPPLNPLPLPDPQPRTTTPSLFVCYYARTLGLKKKKQKKKQGGPAVHARDFFFGHPHLCHRPSSPTFSFVAPPDLPHLHLLINAHRGEKPFDNN